MSNKRHRTDLRGRDDQSPEYWEEVLGRLGLGMSRGNTTHVVYVGGNAIVERIEGERRMTTGRVDPEGQSPQ
jgi:hypothetical protein